MNLIKSKKAADLLTPETLKILLAVIGIVILVTLAVKLFGMFTDEKDLGKAEASLEIIVSEIEKLEEKEGLKAEFFIESPNGWHVMAWPNDDKLGMPVKCRLDYCICLCPIYNPLECDKQGVCEDFSTKIVMDDVKIDGILELKASSSPWGITINEI